MNKGYGKLTAAAVPAVCFLLGMVSRGILESFTVFLLPLAGDLGWDRASLAGIYSLTLLASGLSSPFVGLLFDRWGPQRLYMLGLACLCAGILTGSTADTRWHFYLGLSLPLGFAAAALGNVPHTALLSRWYKKRLSSITGLVYSAIGIGPLIMLPLATGLIHGFGWRGAYQWLAVGAVAVLLPLLLFAPWPRFAAGHPDLVNQPFATAAEDVRAWTLAGAARSLPFWALFWVFCFTAMGIYSTVVQVVAYLVDAGFDALTAASAFGFTGLLTPVGMVGAGLLADRFSRRRAVALTYALTLAGLIVLYIVPSAPSLWLLSLFVLTMGLSLGSRGPLISTLATALFRGPHVGGILGAITLGGGLGGSFGAWMSGMIYDLTGGYELVLVFSMICVALGSLPFWTIAALARR